MGSTRSRICATVSFVGEKTSSALPGRPSAPGSRNGLTSAPRKKSVMSLRRREAPIRSSVRSPPLNNSWAPLRCALASIHMTLPPGA
jgi:hypothetical protein